MHKKRNVPIPPTPKALNEPGRNKCNVKEWEFRLWKLAAEKAAKSCSFFFFGGGWVLFHHNWNSLNFFFFYWAIVDLQWWVHFCCTANWISCTYVYTLFFMFFSITLYQRILNIVPHALQQGLVYHPVFSNLRLLTPDFQSTPPHPVSPLAASRFSVPESWLLFFRWVHSCHILDRTC